jgi:hypothetical protein
MMQERAMQGKGDRYEKLIESVRARDARRRRLSALVKAVQNRAQFRVALRSVGAAA